MYRKSFFVLASVILLLAALATAGAAAFSAWSPAASLESVPGSSENLNTAFLDGCPILSKDGKQLYFASNRPGGEGGIDIWMAERDKADGPFGDPVNLGEPINSADNDFCPSPLQVGNGFMFVSNRPGYCGDTPNTDIYLTRYDPVDGWQEPQNLGCHVNSPYNEEGPVLALPGRPTLYFSSNRPGGVGGSDLYQSEMGYFLSFKAAKLVPGVNSSDDDAKPYVRRDGLELFFDSNRSDPLAQGATDIYSASRTTVVDDWSTPENLGTAVNSTAGESRPSLSWDGKTLLFGSGRPGKGSSDIYFSTRE